MNEPIQRNPADLKEHEFAVGVFGEPMPFEVDELAASIAAERQREPIHILPDGRVLAGVTRWRAAIKLGLDYVLCVVRDDLKDEAAIKRFIIESNLLRHQLDSLTIARCYAELKKLERARSGKKGKAGGGDLRDRLAKRLGAGSGRNLDRWEKALKAPIEVQLAYRAGEISLDEVVNVARLPETVQTAIAGEIRDDKKAKDVIKAYVGKRKPAGKPGTTTAKKGPAKPPVATRKASSPNGTDAPAGKFESNPELIAEQETAAPNSAETPRIEAGSNTGPGWTDPVSRYRRFLATLKADVPFLEEQFDKVVGSASDMDAVNILKESTDLVERLLCAESNAAESLEIEEAAI